MIGIEEPVNLIAKQDYSKTQKLSWRMLSPIFFIPEEQIFRSDSIVTTPGFRNITVAISALKYCFDGKKVMIPNKEGKDASISRNAIAIYISKQIQQLMDEKERIQEIIASRGTVNIEETLSEQVTKLEHINQETQRLFDQSRMMLQSKIQISDRLRELEYMLDRFTTLEEGYKSDIDRLTFIIEGEKVRHELPKQIKCPFCAGEVKPKLKKSLVASASSELRVVKTQLEELQTVIAANNEEIQNLQGQLQTIDDERTSLEIMIDTTCKPLVVETQKSIHDLKELQRLKVRLEYICEMLNNFDMDMQDYENGKDSSISYDAKAMLGDKFYESLNQYLGEALKICKYDSFMDCHLNRSDFDIVVDGKKKRNQGKGYRAFLNTIMAYCILKLLSLKGAYSPGMLILDSPILSLKEKNEQTSAEMKENLFNMILGTDFSCQIIIVENNIPDIDYSKANVIHFTKDLKSGRYGFLQGV